MITVTSCTHSFRDLYESDDATGERYYVESYCDHCNITVSRDRLALGNYATVGEL